MAEFDVTPPAVWVVYGCTGRWEYYEEWNVDAHLTPEGAEARRAELDAWLTARGLHRNQVGTPAAETRSGRIRQHRADRIDPYLNHLDEGAWYKVCPIPLVSVAGDLAMIALAALKGDVVAANALVDRLLERRHD